MPSRAFRTPLFAIAALLATTHPLPAPVTVLPAPTPKPKPKPPAPGARFFGTWSGSASGTITMFKSTSDMISEMQVIVRSDLSGSLQLISTTVTPRARGEAPAHVAQGLTVPVTFRLEGSTLRGLIHNSSTNTITLAPGSTSDTLLFKRNSNSPGPRGNTSIDEAGTFHRVKGQ